MASWNVLCDQWTERQIFDLDCRVLYISIPSYNEWLRHLSPTRWVAKAEGGEGKISQWAELSAVHLVVHLPERESEIWIYIASQEVANGLDGFSGT